MKRRRSSGEIDSIGQGSRDKGEEEVNEKDNAEINDDDHIACDGLGDVLHIDEDDRKFYAAFQTCDLVVKFGDCVRIVLESNDGDDEGETVEQFAFGQVLAIYENKEEEIYIEVRWFLQPHELTKQKKQIINPLANELIETDQLDDIPAGSVTEVIQIKGSNPSGIDSSDHFICRYLESNESRATQKISVHTILKRGLEFSHYKEAYANYLKSTNGMLADDYSIAIQRLQISVIPDELPCRENERKFIDNYIREVVTSHRTKPPLYICGMPGTGKTATVLSCLNNLRKEVDKGLVPEFDFIEINCLRLKSPADAYTQLWRGLTGYHVSAKTAQNKLSSFFASNQIRIKTTGTDNREHILVCLMDELDFLLTRDFRVIYNLFDWSMHERSGFLLIGISNTMDLPERISARVESRTIINIQRQIFQPYNYSQVNEIIEKRLINLHLKYFDKKAIEFISRKASNTVSDLRAALQICQTTLAMFRDFLTNHHLENDDNNSNNNSNTVDMKKYSKEIFTMIGLAVDKYKAAPFVAVIAQLCDLYKAIMIVFCKHRRLVCGGDEHSPVAGMTMIMAWEKFTDFMNKIQTDDFYRSNGGGGGGSSSANVVDDRSSLSSTGRILLQLPPIAIFQDALTNLTKRALLSATVSYRPCGRPIIVYHLNSALLYSDVLAALNHTPWHRFLIT